MRRGGDYEEDARRINRMIDFRDIEDRRDYDRKLSEFFGKDASSGQVSTFWNTRATQDELKNTRFFRKAGGKSLEIDRQKTAVRIVRRPIDYQRQGAQTVDLKGFDINKTRRQYGYRRGRRVMIDQTRTKVVQLKPTYNMKTRSGKVVTIKRKELYRIYIFDKKGRRLGLKKR